MDALISAFDERLREIEAYLELLAALEREIQSGPPRLGSAAITAQQQRILYSSVYLQLYNLVEATVTWCLEAVCNAAAEGGRWRPTDLREQLRREWIRVQAKTQDLLSPENRLETAVAFFERLTEGLPISPWSLKRRGGGNWDHLAIEEISERLGCQLQVSQSVQDRIKRHIRNEKNSLALIRDLRNQLAHGLLSFEECGDGVTVGELKDIKDRTADYLREVVTAFQTYINGWEFLVPSSRPTPGLAND